jgi:diguanylate cyclase (GGDEF)-like protein
VSTREAFMAAANRSLRASYEHGEPVALVNINIEGLRTLTDSQQWDLANEVLYEVSSLIKQRVRQDDEIGVFDGTGFLLLLRRVDSQLASLIVKQMMSRLAALCQDRERWGAPLAARCGVAGSGVSQPTLRSLMARATESCRDARQRDLDIVSDLTEAAEAAEV